MARFTRTIAEQQNLARISMQMPVGGIVRVVLTNGFTLEGVLRGCSSGNNAGQGGWQYYGECQIDDKTGSRHTVDYLDIDDVIALNDAQMLADYERLGLIRIVGR
jgi:hypothetical protein